MSAMLWEEVEKLSPQTGDVLMFRIGSRNPAYHADAVAHAHKIERRLLARGVKVDFVFLLPGMGIEKLTDAELAAAGLQRVPAKGSAIGDDGP